MWNNTEKLIMKEMITNATNLCTDELPDLSVEVEYNLGLAVVSSGDNPEKLYLMFCGCDDVDNYYNWKSLSLDEFVEATDTRLAIYYRNRAISDIGI